MSEKTSDEINTANLLSDFAVGVPTFVSKGITEKISGFSAYEEDRVLLGHVLFRIIGDDENFFNSAMINFDRLVRRPHPVDRSRTELIRRIGWELEQPQTPEEVKRLLESAKAKLEANPWSSEETVKEARSMWEQEAKLPVKQKVNDWESMVDEYHNFLQEVRQAGVDI